MTSFGPLPYITTFCGLFDLPPVFSINKRWFDATKKNINTILLYPLCTNKKKKNTKYKQNKKKNTNCIVVLQKSFFHAKMQVIKGCKPIYPDSISPVPALQNFEFVQKYKYKSVKNFHDFHQLHLFELSSF